MCEWYERGFGFEGSFEGGRKQICFYVFFWGVGGGKVEGVKGLGLGKKIRGR